MNTILSAISLLPFLAFPQEQVFDCQFDESCRDIAEVIYYEARGEPLKGKIAVAFIVLNRVESKFFPNTIQQVIYKRCQFSYTCDKRALSVRRNMVEWEKSLKIAQNVYLNWYEDPTQGSDHYLNKKKLTKLPKWATVYPEIMKIGNHTFYKRLK
jgi:spore germination cell wall hydrolase CwlJ-like protein